MTVTYVSALDTVLRPTPTPGATGIQTLLGARLVVDDTQVTNGFAPAVNRRNQAGFVDLTRVSATQQLKVFYVDVGQGDATRIEAEDAFIIIDGGPNRGFFDNLMDRLADLRETDALAGLTPRRLLEINAVVVTHFDIDHYRGITRVLEHPEFRVRRLYHNGLPRYGEGAGKDLDLGTIVNHQDGTRSISTDLIGLASARALLAGTDLHTPNGNLNEFGEFLQAAVNAAAENPSRLDSMRRLFRRDTTQPAPQVVDTGPDITFEVLAPVTTTTTGEVRLPTFPNPENVTPTNPNPAPSRSHTINGNSIVLKLTYGTHSFLFGGDLNQPAQRYLADRYGTLAPFQAQVNKACHHGSSDFDLPYLQAVNPDASVFSSGDNGNHDHPLPDAMGAAARHSAGQFPLLFSTELARETGSRVHFGHINARSNGTDLVMAQKKERRSDTNPWHTFPVPFPGPFG